MDQPQQDPAATREGRSKLYAEIMDRIAREIVLRLRKEQGHDPPAAVARQTVESVAGNHTPQGAIPATYQETKTSEDSSPPPHACGESPTSATPGEPSPALTGNAVAPTVAAAAEGLVADEAPAKTAERRSGCR